MANIALNTLFFSTLMIFSTGDRTLPNIVLIIADDLGWDDVSFHGSDQILTPNIDLLAYSGVALGRFYTHCACTPSRTALLTGKYAHRMGMQGYPLTNGEDRGIPLSEKLLPEYLREYGYATHLVGKWHVGLSRKEYLPTSRGFDSHFGHRGGFIDYYEYTLQETKWDIGKVSGFDFYRNLSADWDTEGYVTDLYNEEAKSIINSHDLSKPLFLMVSHNAPHSGNDGALLQAPPQDVRAMRHIESPERRIYAAMVKKLDDSVGDIVNTLQEKHILNNSIVVIISDNGGMTSGNSQNYASNWPLRGVKMAPFEGGVRVVGIIWTPGYNNSNHLYDGFIHIVDLFPTLLSAAGIETDLDIDGIDLWDDIMTTKNSKRDTFYEIDDYQGFASVTHDNYKLITGTVLKDYASFQGQDLKGVIGNLPAYTDKLNQSLVYSILEKISTPFQIENMNLRDGIRVNCESTNENMCIPDSDNWCLYDIRSDPCERYDLHLSHPDVAQQLYALLEEEMKSRLPRIVPLYRDPRALPSLHNYTWTTWADNI